MWLSSLYLDTAQVDDLPLLLVVRVVEGGQGGGDVGEGLVEDKALGGQRPGGETDPGKRLVGLGEEDLV